MTKTPRIHHKSKRSAVILATAAAALLATTPFASAKKPDPAVLTAVGSATTSDIEQAAIIGANTADSIGNGTIKLSTTNVNALVAGIANAIIAKVPAPADPINPNRIGNKVDEIGELAAQVFAAVGNNAKVPGNVGQAKKYALAVMKSALKSAAKSSDFLSTNIVSDVVRNVAFTIHNDSAFAGIEAKLAKALGKSSKKIAGKANAGTVVAALAAGFTSTEPSTIFENGNLRQLTTITDPETDLRNG